MKKNKKIKLILFPSLLLVPLTLGITLSACNSSSNDNNINKPETNPNQPQKPDPVPPQKPDPVPPIINQDIYKITFKEKSEFEYGEPNIQIWNIDKNWIKQKILDNKFEIFNIPNNLNQNYDWNENLLIGDFYGNADLGEINFDLTLRKANNDDNILQKYITKNIKITGFSYTNNKLRQEIDRINKSKTLQLMFTKLTTDELDFLNQDNILYYLNEKFESKDFDYNAIEFKKDTFKQKIEFKIQVSYKKGIDISTEPLTTKLLSLPYTFNPDNIQYSLDIEYEDPSRKNNYEEYICLIGKLNTGSTLFNFNWTISDDFSAEVKEINFSNKANYFAFDPGEYTVYLDVTNTKNKLIAHSEIKISSTKEYYKIDIFDPSSPKFLKQQTQFPSYYIDKKQEIKQIINDNKNDLFYRTDDYVGAEITDIHDENISKNFIDNLKINKIFPDDDFGKLIINLTLENATFDGKSVTGDLILANFNKNLSDDEILEKALNNVTITPKDNLSKYTAKEGVAYVQELFKLNEDECKQNCVDIKWTATYDPKNESQIIFKITGILLISSKKEKTINKTQGGFNVIKNLGELDLKSNTILKTPTNDVLDYKHNESIQKIDISRNTTTGDWNSKASKFGWNQYEKEVVYHARFALYQAFHDNFTEINYYALKNDPSKIHVIAEGVVKKDFKNKYIIQSTQEMQYRDIDLKAKDILRVEYIVPINYDNESFYPTTHTTHFSFSNDSTKLNESYGWWKVFGMQLPGYKLNIQTVDQNGRVLRNWWNHSNNKMRSFIFSIAASQGRVN